MKSLKWKSLLDPSLRLYSKDKKQVKLQMKAYTMKKGKKEMQNFKCRAQSAKRLIPNQIIESNTF